MYFVKTNTRKNIAKLYINTSYNYTLIYYIYIYINFQFSIDSSGVRDHLYNISSRILKIKKNLLILFLYGVQFVFLKIERAKML